MFRHLVLALSLAAFAVAAEPRPVSVARPLNGEDLRRRLGLLPDYAYVPRLSAVTIAVLDTGFDGVGADRPYLPRNTVVVEHYDPAFVRRHNLGAPDYRKPFLPGDIHGRLMAQLAWVAAGNSPDGPKFLLLNANGPTLFRRAVRYAMDARADVILFSGTFEGAGNYDGRGPINAAVSEAVAAGILWVNAAGNRGGMVYNGPIVRGADGYLQFPNGGLSSLRFRNRLDENAVSITLTWNDYQDAEDAGTEKDLDLFVEDARGRVLSSSELRQVPPGRPAADGETKNPREKLLLTDLPAVAEGQEYRIRIRARSGNFGPRDRFRVMLTPVQGAPMVDPGTGKSLLPVEFVDATRGGEIYPPADHPGVLTVGDTTAASSVGPTADGRVKPDVILSESLARFSNGSETAGSSNAAAYFAGVMAVLRATEPRFSAGHVREWVRYQDETAAKAEAPVNRLPIMPPPQPVVGALPLSPNQQRAFRYAESAAAEQRAKGLPAPGVWVTGTGGDFLFRPGLPRSTPQLLIPNAPAATSSAATGLPHAAWRTPSPRAVADLLRILP